MKDDKPIILWCDSCKVYYRTTPKRFSGLCPKCGGIATTMRCCRCAYTWQLKNINKLPGTCPSCCSPYFATERKKEIPPEKRAKSKANAKEDLPQIEVRK